MFSFFQKFLSSNPDEKNKTTNNGDHQQNQTQTVTEFSVVTTPDSHFVVNGVVNKKQVLIDILTPPKPQNEDETKARPPLNLCVVLDRSGSMAERKRLEFAKKAICNVVDLLQDDDVFHLVTYDNVANACLQGCSNLKNDKAKYHKAINAIQADGGTNLSAGIHLGYELLAEHKKEGYNNRMFLFSDGLVNQGIKGRGPICKMIAERQEKFPFKIDSFGIGEGFDSDLMKAIAEAGHAQFFYLESANEIQKLVVRALGGITDTLGSRAKLSLRGKNGALVEKIVGSEDCNLVEGLDLGDLHFNNSRKILIQMSIPGNASSKAKAKANGEQQQQLEEEEEELVFLSYEVSYLPVGTEEEEKRVTVVGELSFKLTDDTEVAKKVNDKVQAFGAVQSAAEMDKNILSLVQQGRVTEAIKAQKDQIEYLDGFVRLDDDKQMIGTLVKLAKQSLEKLKERGNNRQEMAQEYNHKMYMKRRGSVCYVDMYD